MQTNKPRVAVIIRCFAVNKVILAIKTFPALDDVNGLLVILADLPSDLELSNLADKNHCKLIYTRYIKTDFDLEKILISFDDQLKWVVFWPRQGMFSRAAGLNIAISLFKESNTDCICGLVKYENKWVSDSGNIFLINNNMSMLIVPMELENYSWSYAGAHSVTEIEIGGSLFLTKISNIPKFIPLMSERISWGLIFTLANEDTKKLKCKLFTGFQVITKLREEGLQKPKGIDAEIFYDLMMKHSIVEIVLFNKGKLVRDDENQITNFQKETKLSLVSNGLQIKDVQSFYQSKNNQLIIGPLLDINDDFSKQTISKQKYNDIQNRMIKYKNQIDEIDKKINSRAILVISKTKSIDILNIVLMRVRQKILKRIKFYGK